MGKGGWINIVCSFGNESLSRPIVFYPWVFFFEMLTGRRLVENTKPIIEELRDSKTGEICLLVEMGKGIQKTTIMGFSQHELEVSAKVVCRLTITEEKGDGRGELFGKKESKRFRKLKRLQSSVNCERKKGDMNVNQ